MSTWGQEFNRAPARTGNVQTKTTSYTAFARFYDAVQGERAEHAAYLRELIDSYHPAARTVLEVACGTGSILKQLQPDFEVAGLDLSAPMLELSAEKVPGVPLVEADMAQFHLDDRFDVVLCVYDSINHLLNFTEWEAVFDRTHEHLNDRGLFIPDINTERRLAALTEEPPAVQWFGDGHLLVLDVRDEGSGVVTWAIRVFEHQGEHRYLLHAEDIREVSFPRSRIDESMRARFGRVSAHDQRRTPPRRRRSASTSSASNRDAVTELLNQTTHRATHMQPRRVGNRVEMADWAGRSR